MIPANLHAVESETSKGAARYEHVDTAQAPTTLGSFFDLTGSNPDIRIPEIRGDVGDRNLRLRGGLDEPDNWTGSLERRFVELAALSAENRASDEEVDELERLIVYRRMLNHPRTYDEVRRSYQEQRLLNSLLKAAQRYVSFVSTAH